MGRLISREVEEIEVFNPVFVHVIKRNGAFIMDQQSYIEWMTKQISLFEVLKRETPFEVLRLKSGNYLLKLLSENSALESIDFVKVA